MRDDAPPSANSRTPTVDRPLGGFALAGPSGLPDPATHAYRKDLADVALAGLVIASHYAEPLERVIVAATPLLASPTVDGLVIAQLEAGAAFRMLDNSRGWAWGYYGAHVGYLRGDAVSS